VAGVPSGLKSHPTPRNNKEIEKRKKERNKQTNKQTSFIIPLKTMYSLRLKSRCYVTYLNVTTLKCDQIVLRKAEEDTGRAAYVVMDQ
jgi:hypothetical protein